MPNARTKQDAAEGRIEAARCRRKPQGHERSRNEQGARSNRRIARSEHEDHPEGNQGDAGGEAGRCDAARSSGFGPPAEGRHQADDRGDQAGDVGTTEPSGRGASRDQGCGCREAGTDGTGPVDYAADPQGGAESVGSSRTRRRLAGLALRRGLEGPSRRESASERGPVGTRRWRSRSYAAGFSASFKRASSFATLAESSA